jgi:uncharacterized membrane protein YesL
VRFLKLLWRGVRDVFEQFVLMVSLSLVWWVCLVTVVLAPPATVTLFALADPRRIVNRPDMSDAVAVFKTSVKRGWLIALATLPALAVLAWNILFFSGTSSFLRAFVPLWAIMLISLFILSIYMFSVAGTMESGLRNAFRGAMYVLVSRPFTALLLSLLIIAVGAVMTVLVLPMLALGPALLAAVINRFVLTGLHVEIIDPFAPTNERTDERQRGIEYDKTFWQRLRGSSRRT